MSNKDQSDYIREAIREALSEKEEAERNKAVESLLATSERTIDGLNETIADKEKELAVVEEARSALNSQSEELTVKVTSLEKELTEAKKNTEKAEERAETAEKELTGIAAVARLKGRIAELEEAKVVSSSEKSRKNQEARVKDMKDEEFAAYKSEMVDMRNQLAVTFKEAAEELKASAEQKTEEEKAAEIAAAANVAGKKVEDEAAAAASALNIEVASVGMKEKYARLGKAMAEAVKNNK